MASPEAHIHDPITEGPLPEGFPIVGREGKVRNIYIDGGRICLIASDRVSAFDQVSPTPIPGKGIILNDIASQELRAAESAGIPTWLEEIPRDNPRAAVGRVAEVLPVEMIFRNYLTGSMWRTYRDTGDFTGLGLPAGLRQWHDFSAHPLCTPSTKSDLKDINFNPADVEKMTGISTRSFAELEEIGRELFRLGTKRAKERGLVLVDTKYEMGIDLESGQVMVIDEVHTPDSSRFCMEDGFEAAIQSGDQPVSLSKEFLRAVILELAGGDEAKAKELMRNPLKSSVVDELIERYETLHSIFMK